MVLHLVDGHLVRVRFVEDGVGEIALYQAVDGRVERRREQQRLVWTGDVAEQPFDLRHEPHVGHAVRLVDDQGRDLREGDRLAVDEIDEASRGRDDEVEAPGHHEDLLVEVGSAVDGADPPVDRLAQPGEHLGHLECQLTRRFEDERGRQARL